MEQGAVKVLLVVSIAAMDPKAMVARMIKNMAAGIILSNR